VGIEQLNQLGEVRQRPCQTIDLVDDDDVDLPGADIVQQLLKVGAIGGPAGVSSIVIRDRIGVQPAWAWLLM
jgi:hypothetical protein